MPVVDSVIFQRSSTDYLDRARHEPVEITRHGRRAYVLMSADHYDWLRAAARRAHRTADAADVVIESVERAQMDDQPG